MKIVNVVYAHQAVQVSSLTTRKQSNAEQYPTVLLMLAKQ